MAERVPGISRKMGFWQVGQSFSSLFAIFDDFSKFLSTFGMLHFENSLNMAKILVILKKNLGDPVLGIQSQNSGFGYPFPLCKIFTILLTLWNSEQKNGLLMKLFCFSSDFDETWWSCSYSLVLKFHQVSSKSDEKQ